MTMVDKYDEQAERLLPCNQDTLTHTNEPYEHPPSCPAYYRSVVAKLRTELTTEIERLWREINGLRPEADDEGSCLRCGLGWDDEKDENDKHQCPPGFWNDNEKEIAKLRNQLAEKREIGWPEDAK